MLQVVVMASSSSRRDYPTFALRGSYKDVFPPASDSSPVDRYARIQMDDRPLYAFDSDFALPRRKFRMDREYSVPDLFPEDLLSCVGEDQRPPYRYASGRLSTVLVCQCWLLESP